LPKRAFFPRNKPNFHREFNAGNSVPDPVTMRYRRSSLGRDLFERLVAFSENGPRPSFLVVADDDVQ
jgi:hypothetical protein